MRGSSAAKASMARVSAGTRLPSSTMISSHSAQLWRAHGIDAATKSGRFGL